MKTDIKSLQDSFESWYAINEKSRNEASRALDMYNDRQWAPEQMMVLEERGQPKETFNIVKLMTRTLVGYYASVVNKAVIEPVNYNHITKATLLNDAMKTVNERNDFDTIGDDIKMFGMLTGLFASYTSVVPTGTQDAFGQNEYTISTEYINPETLVIDPLSSKKDMSDARGIHRFKWLDEETVKKVFGKNQKTIDKLDEYVNHVNIDQAEFTYRYDSQFIGKYKVANMYLVIHSVIGRESIFWCGDVELSRTKIPWETKLSPYTVIKLNTSNKEEYYGIFREVIESQKAINQALIQIQLLVNSNKVIVETGAVEDIDKFADAIARVNAVAEVDDLRGVMIQNMSQTVLDQYTIIDRAYQRIKAVLGINDSMLGDAYAADSARKVKLQKNNGIMTLRYLTAPLQLFYKRHGELTARLIVQYFTAHQMLRVTDDVTGTRYVEINKPLIIPKLPPDMQRLVAQGLPLEYAMEALMTGQLNPNVMEAIGQDQQLQQAHQQYQQQQQQAAMVKNQQQQQMVNNKISGEAPMPVLPPPPPPANNAKSMPKLDMSNQMENSQQTKINKMFAMKKPNAPRGMDFVFEEMLDPMTGEPLKDRDGNIYMRPSREPESTLDIKEFEVLIKTSSFDDEDEKAQLLMEVMLNGPAGQFAQQVSPAKYAKMVSLNVQSMKTKYSPEIAKMFNDMAEQLGEDPHFEAYIRMMSAGGPQQNGGNATGDGNGGALPPSQAGNRSSELKLPQNTNEGF